MKRIPAALQLYQGLTRMSAPALTMLLRHRLKAGKEDPARWHEKRGESSIERPDGSLIWIHAASVGESLSVLPLIAALLNQNAARSILVTSGTRTSAEILQERLPKPNAFHQFAPLDHPRWVRRFFDHWRPDLGFIVESELWPNLMLSAEARGLPLILLNARISPKSTENWLSYPDIIQRLMHAFRLVLAQDSDSAARLYALGANRVETVGNLKYAADPLPDKQQDRARLADEIGARPCWLAASTHPGEEQLVAQALTLLRLEFPALLTIIVPRHPERGTDIERALRPFDFDIACRSRGETITADTALYIADTLGELGLFYRLCPIAFIGGTLVSAGGQNPLEPARLNCAIIHGSYTDNFAEIFGRLRGANASLPVTNVEVLAQGVRDLLMDDAQRGQMTQRAAAIASGEAAVLERVMRAISPFLPDLKVAARATA